MGRITFRPTILNLYEHFTGDHHIDDKIMMLLVRAIKVVINYE